MKKIFLKYVSFLCLVILLSSCITNKQKMYLQHDKKNRYEMKPFKQYQLVVNDEIIFYLMTGSLETQSLYNGGGTILSDSKSYRIYEDGCVVLPTIGRVPIAGLTIREAEGVIREKFKAIVLDAEVKITMANNYFYVLGDGGKGQFYVYKENLNIFQALALAGDISSIGDKKHVKIIRGGSDKLIEVDLRRESIVESEYYYIHPNDVIYIPTTSKSFYRIESITGFITIIAMPLSLIALSISFLKK